MLKGEGVKATMLILAWISNHPFLINNRPWACVYTTHDVSANDTLWLQAEERASLVGRGRGPVAVSREYTSINMTSRQISYLSPLHYGIPNLSSTTTMTLPLMRKSMPKTKSAKDSVCFGDVTDQRMLRQFVPCKPLLEQFDETGDGSLSGPFHSTMRECSEYWAACLSK